MLINTGPQHIKAGETLIKLGEIQRKAGDTLGNTGEILIKANFTYILAMCRCFVVIAAESPDTFIREKSRCWGERDFFVKDGV
jgi:hypothetical protein